MLTSICYSTDPIDELLLTPRNLTLPINTEENRLHITIRRKHVWEDTLYKFKCGLNICQQLRVTFIGEPAIDDGGPMQEYLRLLLSAIVSNDSILSGDSDKRILRHNIIELNRSTYLYVGKIISMSLVHGGPAPSFFS